VCESLPKVTL